MARPPSPPGAPAWVGGKGAFRGTLVVSGTTAFSRILGFVRDAAMASLVGISPELGAFHIAWVVPNLFRRLFGEGAVSAAVLPALARAEREGGRDATRALFRRFQGVLLLTLGAVLAISLGVVFLLYSGSRNAADREALLLTLLLLPYLVPICLTALAGAPQQLTGRYLLPALAPALLNTVWITTLLAVWAFLGFDDSMRALLVLGGGILAGVLLQWLIQVPGVRAAGFSLAPSWDRGDGTVARTIRAFAPALIGLAAVQINFAVDQILVRALVDPSANTYTHLANRLLQLPLALIGISASTGVAPLFARLAAEGSFPALTRALKRSCEMSLLVILAAGGGLFLLAEPVVTVLFQHGRFDAGNTAVLAPTLRAYLWGLPAAALAGLLIRARQSRGDFRGPAWIAASVVPVNLALDWILLPRMGVPGAGYATSASLILQALFLGAGLRGLEIGGPLGIGRLPRLLAPGFLVVAAVLPLRSLLAEQAATVWGLALLVGAGIAVAAAGTAWLLPAEFQELRGALRRRGRASSQGR